MDNLNPGKKEYNKPGVKSIKFSKENLDDKSVFVNEIPISQRAAIATFYRMTPADFKELKAAKGDSEVFKEKTRQLWKEIAVHGFLKKDKVTGLPTIINFSDLDGKSCIGLLKLANINIENVKYVKPGDFVPGRINFDTGERYGFIVEDEGKTVFLDHHGPQEYHSSATKITYEALQSMGLLKKTEVLDNLVEFVNHVDNKTFPDEPKYFKDSYNMLLGLSNFAGFPKLLEFFEDGRKPTDRLFEEELRRYGFIYKDKQTDEIVNRSEQAKSKIEKSLEQLKNDEANGLIIESERFGKIVVDINRQIPNGFDAARAYGCDTYINWNKENNGYFISTTNKIDFVLSQGIKVRGKMYLKPAADGLPLTISLSEVLRKFTDDKLKPTGKLAKYLQEEKAERQRAEELELQKLQAVTPQESEATAAALSSRNKGFFKRMSETGKKIVNHFYKHLAEIPSPQMVMGKMKIAYNKFWHDKNKKKADALKAEVDRFDLQIRTLTQSENEISAQIENMKKQEMPGIAAMQLRLRDITQQKNKLQTERNRFASKYKIQADDMGLYANKLDRISGGLLENYNDKVRPIDTRMRQLQQSQNRMDLISAITTAKHNNLLEVLAEIGKKKTELETSLRSAGLSEREIRNSMSVKVLEEQLVENKAKIEAEKDELVQQQDDMNIKLAPVIDMAQFFKAKKEELASLRQSQPYQVEVSTRRKEAVDIGQEQVMNHGREQEGKLIYLNARRKSAPAVFEASAETNERLDTTVLLSGWNEYLKKMFSQEEANSETIDQNNFLGETMLTGSEKFAYQDFKNILGVYCRVKNIPTVKLRLYFDKYTTEKSAQEKEQQKQAA